MRRSITPLFLRFMMFALVLAVAGPAAADDRSDARTHYMAGVKFYNAQDYRSAIREFSAAQQLVPADLNNYNLALCYDKLGDAEPAVQYYRSYLDKVPSTEKRAEIEASVARLDAANKSVAAKKAEEARKAADEARKADEAKKVAEDARKADEAKKAAAVAAKRPAAPPDLLPDPDPAPVGVGSTGVPSNGQSVITGDAQLDRVQQIDINAIRDERMGGGASGIPDTRGGPQGQPQAGVAQQAPGPNAGAPAPQAQQPLAPQDQPQKKADPVYKKWWFWAIVAVGAYVVYQIATEDSNSDDFNSRMFPQQQPANARSGGMTLLSW